MMPALARTRQQARRTVSAMNLKQLGLALNMYADEHQGTLPDSIEQAKDYYGNAKILESPFKPKDFEGPSYIYIAGQDLSMYPGNFLAYENPGFCFEGVNVLHLDGHVEWMRPDVFMHELEATYKRLGREMPEIEFKNP